MANAVWPATLPQYFLMQSFEERFPNQMIRTSMDVGPAKVRRRTTSSPRNVSGVIEINITQRTVLEEFFLNTLRGGSLPFDWVEPFSGSPATYRFLEPPSLTSIGGQYLSATMKLERLP